MSPVTNVANGFGYIIVVNATVPEKTVQELIAVSKSRSKPLAFGFSGVGNPQHIAGEPLNDKVKIQLLHLQSKGGAGSDGIAWRDEVQLMLMPPTLAPQHLTSYKLHVLACTTA